jgi:2-keto-4-pentenoate hydratase
MTQSSLHPQVVESLARELWQAETTRDPVPPLTGRVDEPDPGSAYRVQLAVAALRVQLGHRVVGKKVGLTSKAMQEMAGFAQPDYGHLFDVMQCEDRGSLSMDSLIHPKVEPEIAFVLDRPLRGPGVSAADVLRATAYVAPALEIVDSRIQDWKIRWIDTVADNGSSARFVLGGRAVSPRGIDFRTLGVVLERQHDVAATATMAAVMGNPVIAVAWLANKLGEWDLGLAEGDVVLPGSPCRAIDVRRGDFVEAHMSGLGSVALSFH